MKQSLAQKMHVPAPLQVSQCHQSRGELGRTNQRLLLVTLLPSVTTKTPSLDGIWRRLRGDLI